MLHLKVVGKTEDNKTVVAGLFKMCNQEGLPLDVLFDICIRYNLIPDWIDFCREALHCGWSPKTILNRLDSPLVDVYGVEFKEVVVNKLKKLME